jgi:uncharacterized protein YggE
MDRYIEVIGEGQFVETASRFIAELTLEVRATKDETAFREVAELCSEALAILRDAGIGDDEIIEGGTDIRLPWYWKKKAGQSAARKVVLKVAEFGRLNHALEQLEPLQSRNKERKTVSVDMRQPEFQDAGGAKANALAQAFEDAWAKAERLAIAMNCELGRPIQFEESGWARRNSGFSGDEDWGGDYSRFASGGGFMWAAGGAAAAEPEPDLQRPTRTIFVKCRVRFAIG